MYEKLSKLDNEYDFSEYPEEHVLRNKTNKKRVGIFKDELNGNLINKFISLRSKIYAFTKLNETKEKKVLKGITRSVVEKRITFDEYYKCLMEDKASKLTCMRFQSDHHQVYTVEVNKIGLSAVDDKRYFLDNIRSRPYGVLRSKHLEG